jgi:hypothetical protein
VVMVILAIDATFTRKIRALRSYGCVHLFGGRLRSLTTWQNLWRKGKTRGKKGGTMP